MDDGNEMFDVVDSEDKVIGRATRRQVHARGLLHRSVHILVFNSRGELFLQKRAMTKDENPGFWDTSAAGHVNAGEDYPESAIRELKEELGISAELTPFIKINASAETLWEHVWAYTSTTDQPIEINPVEISEGRFWNLGEVKTALGEGKDQFTSTFKILFDLYMSSFSGKPNFDKIS